jgi:hypothetical protein
LDSEELSMTKNDLVIAAGRIENSILLIRGQKVVLDSELAVLYGVTTKRLNEQVHRNIERFPSDFMFQLTREEMLSLRSQFATSSSRHGGRRNLPYAFTEHGAIMAASVLNSEQAVKVSVYVVRAFVKLREMLANHKELSGKLAELERKLQRHDSQILTLIEAIRQLLEPPPARPRKRIGFASESAQTERP